MSLLWDVHRNILKFILFLGLSIRLPPAVVVAATGPLFPTTLLPPITWSICAPAPPLLPSGRHSFVYSRLLSRCWLPQTLYISLSLSFMRNVFSAAIKACAKAGDIANGMRLFVEGRRAAGIATDNARDVAAAAVAAATAAAESGTAPAAPPRINPGVEAVYMATLEVSRLAVVSTLWCEEEGGGYPDGSASGGGQVPHTNDTRLC